MIPKSSINNYSSYNQEAVQSGYSTRFNPPVFYRNICIYCGNRYVERIDNCKTCGASMIHIHNIKRPIPPPSRIVKDRGVINFLLYFLFLLISFITINILLK